MEGPSDRTCQAHVLELPVLLLELFLLPCSHVVGLRRGTSREEPDAISLNAALDACKGRGESGGSGTLGRITGWKTGSIYAVIYALLCGDTVSRAVFEVFGFEEFILHKSSSELLRGAISIVVPLPSSKNQISNAHTEPSSYGNGSGPCQTDRLHSTSTGRSR